jgi:tRNA A-37 threonylcarbamoyl transferase component Bud32
MAWIEIMPRYEPLFRRLGWDTAAPFLAWTGILVNRHRHRSVEQVSEPEASAKDGASPKMAFFLKKEFAASWRDRLHNAWDGFGWCATAVREAAMLQALRDAGIGCPEVVALGEVGRRAFVVTRAESTMLELRALLATLAFDDDRTRLAVTLGRDLAKMHDAGFHHPDLFAKHILIGNEEGAFRSCILDWQRGRRRRSVSWRIRCRDLAMLDATLHSDLAGDRLRLRLLSAYRRASTNRQGPPLRGLIRQIRRQSESLSQKRRVREIGGLPIPPRDQQFVPFQDGKLLIVRSFFDELGGSVPTWLAELLQPGIQVGSWACPADAERWAVHECQPSATMPPLAHQLFRLHRLGVSAPRLMAVIFTESRTLVLTRHRDVAEWEAVA